MNANSSCPSWSLRASDAQDDGFLRLLYASTRENEEPLHHWPNSHKQKFLAQQYEAQDRHYRSYFPGAEHWIVTVKDKSIGRLILYRTSNDIRIVDISLLPRFRGKGIGSSVLQGLFGQAREAHASVSLNVRTDNTAIRLYRRLGFATCDGAQFPYLAMRKTNFDDNQC